MLAYHTLSKDKTNLTSIWSNASKPAYSTDFYISCIYEDLVLEIAWRRIQIQ